MLKSKLRKKLLKDRERNNKINIQIDFNKLTKIYKTEKINKKIIGGYYPVNFEIDDLALLRKFERNRFIISLPVIKKDFQMDFYKWTFSDPLKVNKFGMLEPILKREAIVPDTILVPLLAFDSNNNRLGYGKGFYDRFLNKFLKVKKKITTIGVAFSFQKYNKLPVSSLDVKLDYILTEKGLKK